MRVSLGYRECPPGSVTIKGLNARELEFHGELNRVSLSDSWGPSELLTVRLVIDVDIREIKEHLGLTENDAIVGGLTSFCPATNLRHGAEAVVIADEHLELSLDLPPFEVNDYLLLEVTLAARLATNQIRITGSPSLDFSRIFGETFRIDLTGSLSSANVLSEDLDALPGYAGALWRVFLDVPEELDAFEIADWSSVHTVIINERRRTEFGSNFVKTALATDLAVAAIDSFFETFKDQSSRQAALEMLRSPGKETGTWIRFLRVVLTVAIGSDFQDASNAWVSDREGARSRLQSHYATNVYGWSAR